MEKDSTSPLVRATPELPAALGHFRIDGVLGEGGSGTVYAAAWGHRRIALKVLRQELLPTEREHQRFLSEAALLQTVEHPGVVKVLGSGTLPDGRPYLAMEHLEGESLAARVARGPMPVAEALPLFDQLASAVQALHDRGLIHRDIKPENVILTGRFAVLLDFGIAKPENAPASTITQEGSLRGTPAYMAPERFFGSPAGVATDLYELAVLFYALVTGRLPWDDVADPSARLNPPPPSALQHPLPGGLETVLLQALSTRAEARPPSVAELARRMAEEASTGGLVAARHTEDLGPAPNAAPPAASALAAALATTARAAPPAGAPPAPPAAAPPPVATTAQPSWPRRHAGRLGLALLVAAGAGAALVALRDRAPAAGSEAAAETAEPAEPAEPVELAPAPSLWEHAGPSAELDELLRLHPGDTLVLVSASPAILRKSELLASALEGEAKAGALAHLALLDATCGFPVIDSVDRVVLGATDDPDVTVDLSVRGSFTRDQVEACLAAALAPDEPAAPVRSGPLTRLSLAGRPVWLGWPAADTFFLSTRSGVDEAWMHARLRREDSLPDAELLVPLLAEVDTNAGLWLVAEPPASAAAPLPGLRAPRAIYGSIRVATGIEIHGGLRYDAADDAEDAAQVLQRSLQDFARDGVAALWLGDAGFSVRGRDVLFAMSLEPTMARMTVEALLDMAK